MREVLYHDAYISVRPNNPVYVGLWFWQARQGCCVVEGQALTKWGAIRQAKKAVRRNFDVAD